MKLKQTEDKWTRPAPKVDEPERYVDFDYVSTPKPVLRKLLAELHGDMCYYCQNEFTDTQDDALSRTIDHYHSQEYCEENGWSFLDTHGITNLVLAHKKCNARKSNRRWTVEGQRRSVQRHGWRLL